MEEKLIMYLSEDAAVRLQFLLAARQFSRDGHVVALKAAGVHWCRPRWLR